MREWWRGGVIYQIYPRSFRDGNGDGIGDLPGIVEGLDHVASLGVDAIWISPFFKSPMKDFGYDVEDYRHVDPLFGSNADFDRVLARAHALGLKVIIDLVLNHTANTHAWFRESRHDRINPRSDWYVWADPKDDGTPPNNWLSVFGGSAWQWDPRREQYYFHQFLPEQPDLNLHNLDVQDACLDILRFWLDRGVDGIRLDACNHYMHDPNLRDNPPAKRIDRTRGDVAPGNPYGMQRHLYDRSRPENLAFIARIRALTDRYADRMVVAEVSCDQAVERSAEYVAGTGRLHTAYSFALLGGQFSAGTIRRVVEAFLAQPGAGWPSWAFSNHDVPRVASRWGGADAPKSFAKMAIVLLASLRGTIFLYQGEELGLPQAHVPHERLLDPYGIAFYPEFEGRDGCRTPIPWCDDAPYAGFSTVEPPLPIPESHIQRAVSVEDRDALSVLGFTRRFLSWRKSQTAIVAGTIHFHPTSEPILAFERRDGAQQFLCVFNLSREAATLALTAAVPAPVGPVAADPEIAARVENQHLVLPPHGVAILPLGDDAEFPFARAVPTGGASPGQTEKRG